MALYDNIDVRSNEIVTVVERLLAQIKNNTVGIGSGSAIDYTALLTAIEQALNSPNPSIPISDINTGEYVTAPIQTKQYQNTQLLKAILACIGQATNLSPNGLTIMGAVESYTQAMFFSTLQNIGVFYVSTTPVTATVPAHVTKLIVHNKGTSNIYIGNPPVSVSDGLVIMPNEKFELEWVRFDNGIQMVSNTGTNEVTLHVVSP